MTAYQEIAVGILFVLSEGAITPFQPEQLSAPHSGGKRREEKGVSFGESISDCSQEQLAFPLLSSIQFRASHLEGLVGSKVRVTMEIEAEIPGRAPDNVVHTVTENSRTLKFISQMFEKE